MASRSRRAGRVRRWWILGLVVATLVFGGGSRFVESGADPIDPVLDGCGEGPRLEEQVAKLRAAMTELAAHSPANALELLPEPERTRRGLIPFVAFARARALVELGRPAEAAQALTVGISNPPVWHEAEQLAFELLRRSEVPTERRLALAVALRRFASREEYRARAAFEHELPMRRAAGNSTAYQLAIDELLAADPIAAHKLVRSRAYPLVTSDVETAAARLPPDQRLERAHLFFERDLPTVALAELIALPQPLAAAAETLRIECLVALGRNAETLQATQRLENLSAIDLARRRLARAAALAGAASAARTRRSRPIGPSDEAIALIEAATAAPSARRQALERAFRARWQRGDDDAALRHFERLAEEFPASTAGRNDILGRGLDLLRGGQYSAAAGYFASLAHVRDPRTHRAALYWVARCRERIGRTTEAIAAWEELARSPAADFYSRQAAVRLAASGHGVRREPWHFPAAPDFEREIPAAAIALREGGLAREALAVVEAERDDSDAQLIYRAELLTTLGESGRAVDLVKAVHPQIQTAGVIGVSEPELRLFYPLAYLDSIRSRAERFDIPLVSLIGLVRQESGFRPAIRSSAGAVGLMQIMPSTGRYLSRKMLGRQLPASRLLDPELSLDLGSYYLKELLDDFDGRHELAYAAYNCGPGRVDRIVKRYPEGGVDLWVESLPFDETRDYVKKIVLYESVYARLYPEIGADPSSRARSS